MIDSYLDDAKRVSKLQSDRALAKELGIGTTTIFHYRHGGAIPSDAVMLQIAELAKIPAEQALLDLALMRSNSEPAKKVLLNLKKRLVTAGCALAVAMALTTPAHAANNCDNMLRRDCVYYGK